MATPLLRTKLYIPPIRPEWVSRSRLVDRLNAGLNRKLALVSAPAGFGKTTLVSEWAATEGQIEHCVAWLSLDGSDNDLNRFLMYLIAALQTVEAAVGRGALSVLESPQPLPAETILTSLINEIAALPNRVILVLDDYHLIKAQSVHDALTFLLEHLPPGLHLVIATREDPYLPLARLRGQGQLTELRASDLRFTSSEAAAFLNQVMGLDLAAEQITALETRTEGWIVGLHLAALALQRQGRRGAAEFIRSFTGSHYHVLDYLIEEVLEQQPHDVQDFLLKTAILGRLTGPLCDALTGKSNGQAILEMLDRANLFIVPLDNERRWYRYHHLFADLLRQRLHHSAASSTPPISSPSDADARARVDRRGTEGGLVAELHVRASAWYEEHGLEVEAFQHAAAANDVERAARLIEGKGVHMPYRGASTVALNWLESLPATELDSRPSLWVTYASALNLAGQPADAEQKLQAAETAIEATTERAMEAAAEADDNTRDLVGHIAAIRAMMAVGQHQLESIIAHSRRALEYLHPDNLALRTIAGWTLGYSYQLQGDREAASQAYTRILSTSQASGDLISTLAAAVGLGNIRESKNQLFRAAESYRRGIDLFGDQPQLSATGAYLGLARVLYEWNDLDAAQQHVQQSLQLAQQVDTLDTPALCWVLLARLKLAQGDAAGASAILAEAERFVRQHKYLHRLPEVSAAQVVALLEQGDQAGAAYLAEKHDLPSSRARVHLARGETAAALAVLEPQRQQVEAEGLEDERLKFFVLRAIALRAHGEKEEAVRLLDDALALAEPGGLIRTFVDEGPPMARLLYEALSRGISPGYVRRLLAAFPIDEPEGTRPSKTPDAESEWVEPLSEREIEVLELIAEGLTNQEIAFRLTLSLNTVKSHARHIYGKLGVRNRTQAVARARVLGVLPLP
jgi:LuxR family maltose regulon positive regulatory protein